MSLARIISHPSNLIPMNEVKIGQYFIIRETPGYPGNHKGLLCVRNIISNGKGCITILGATEKCDEEIAKPGNGWSNYELTRDVFKGYFVEILPPGTVVELTL